MNYANKIVEVKWKKQPVFKKIKGKYPWKNWVKFKGDGEFQVILKFGTLKQASDYNNFLKDNKYVKVDSPNNSRLLFITFTTSNNFICDSTSLPWANDVWGNMHDFLYRIQGCKWGFGKQFCDRAYYMGMVGDKGFNNKLAYVMYIGVKFLGSKAYSKNRIRKYEYQSDKATGEIVDKMGF